ncbi:hypothetical protein PVAND_012886 [Polypedilum vanderplanki]|uniref:PDZ domain-containing protein n=1 Tax=Polypedilum vanderplanki TaxID=319348 RepID=A0A9J6CNS1_POLVA|nr:hypothetical protein PVAND_012886 [Polypedilum vanderplanki]
MIIKSLKVAVSKSIINWLSLIATRICKGPDWKPGIFVQFTKENGIAKEAGLQPGDQIVSCNGIDFSDILFSEAVAVMKASSVLELIIRPSAGLDLFPSESSGYNSSASSVTGDQSPCWGEHAKRLSIVREESTNSNDRLNTFKLRSNRKDPLHVEVPKVPASYLKNQNLNSNNNNNNDGNKGPQNTTIIKLTENGPTLINNTIIPGMNNNNNGGKEINAGISSTVETETSNTTTLQAPKLDPSKKIADICFVSRQNETKIVTVEVHQSSQNGNQLQAMNSKVSNGAVMIGNNETNRDEQSESSSSSSSLSSAISDELKRRAEKKLREQNQLNGNHMPNGNSISQPLQDQLPQKPHQPASSNNNNGNIHEILMDEFKKAHKKMFKNGFVENDYQQKQSQQHMNGSSDDTSQISASLAATNLKSESNNNNSEERQLENKKNGTPRIISNGSEKKKPIAPLPPPKKLDKQVSVPNVKFSEIKEPWTPKPDYDSPDSSLIKQQTDQVPPPPQKGTMSRIALQEIAKAKGDVAEMESLESFRLTSPSSKIPAPPPMYFQTQKFEPTTLKKVQQKPVSVIVSSYDMNKKEPGKLGFVDSANDRVYDENANVDMSTRLKYELEKTLSRSNLRRSLDNILKSDSEPSYDATNDRQIVLMSKKHEPSTLNGILKNGTNKVNGNGTVKNISFDDMAK